MFETENHIADPNIKLKNPLKMCMGVARFRRQFKKVNKLILIYAWETRNLGIILACSEYDRIRWCVDDFVAHGHLYGLAKLVIRRIREIRRDKNG